MIFFSRPTGTAAAMNRATVYAAMFGAAIAISPLVPAWGQSRPQTREGQTQNATPEQIIGQRIAALHDQLKITPSEEQDWAGVAQTMRDNVATMQRLQAERESQSQQPMTALQDLQAYAQYTQAHLDGLKNLIASFTTLYNAMPPPQKKLADQVFLNAQRREGPG